jgi:hypothetical protein
MPRLQALRILAAKAQSQILPPNNQIAITGGLKLEGVQPRETYFGIEGPSWSTKESQRSSDTRDPSLIWLP